MNVTLFSPLFTSTTLPTGSSAVMSCAGTRRPTANTSANNASTIRSFFMILNRETRSAEQPGIVATLRTHDLHTQQRKRAFLNFLPHVFFKQVPPVHDAAGNNDHLGIQNVDEVR